MKPPALRRSAGSGNRLAPGAAAVHIGAMWIAVPRAFLRLSGPDARAFLDNLITQDLGKLAAAPVLYGGLLSPQGKVSADFFIWADDEALILEADPGAADLLRKRLSLYRLRAKVEIEDLAWTAALGFDDAAPPAGGRVAPDPRLPGFAQRWIGPDGRFDPNPGVLLERRVRAGLPDLAQDAGPEEVFALEALFEELNGVAFDKGCFIGQENVSRMKRRATTRKKFCRIAEAGAPPPGSAVLADGVEIGTTRSAANGFAIALLRLDRALAAENLTVLGAPARLDPPDWLILPKAGEDA